MVRRVCDRSFNAELMEEFDEIEVIRASELRDDPVMADLRMLSGGYTRLAQTTTDPSVTVESLESTMVAIQRTLLQISTQLGKRPIAAEPSHHSPPVTHSNSYARDDSMMIRGSELRENEDSWIEIPEFDASNVSDWLSKVEQSFRVRRFSDLDKLDLVAFSLEGYVLQWFSWEMSHNEFRSWDEFRHRLLLKFGAASEESSENVAEILEEKASYTEQKGTVSASVTESAELSSHVIGLDEYHLEQLFSNGLQTEMKEVLKWKEPRVLENQNTDVLRRETSSFCQPFSAETFTSKPVGSVSSLSFAVATEEKMSSGLSHTSQVWEPGGVLAEHVLVDFTGYDGILDGIRCLAIGVCSGINQPIGSRRASRVWERGGLDISTELLVHSGFVGEKLSDEHRAYACAVVNYSEPATYAQAMQIDGWDEACDAEIDALKGVDFIDTFAPVAKLKPGYASRKGDLPENAVLHLKKSIYSLKQVSHQWFLKFSTTLLTLGFTKSFAVHAEAVDQLKDDLKNSFKLRDLGPLNDFLGLEIARSSAGISVCQPKYALELLDEASFWVLGNSNAEQMFHRQQNSSSIWHRWRRKPLFLLHFWKNSWLLSEDLVCVYHSFKLEDKLVFRGESIDTIGDVAADEVEVKTLEQKEVLPLTLRDSNKREKQSSLLFLCELWIDLWLAMCKRDLC